VLAAAQADLVHMEATLSRTQRTFDQGASTQEDLDTATAHRDAAAAAIMQAEAALSIAQLNLSYTDVRSPIMGKADPSTVGVGDMVGPSGRTVLLTTVAGMDPMFVNFDISDAQFNTIRAFAREHHKPVMEEGLLPQLSAAQPLQETREGGAEMTAQEEGAVSRLEEFQIPFEMSLIIGSDPNTGEYPYKGIIETAYNRIDPSTGTIRVRGKIPNADYAVFPGQICRVRIPVWEIENAILVRQEAIGTDMNQRYVYVIDDQNTAHRRVIELGALQPDGTRIVTQGLEAGERYVVSGIQKVRDGSPVKVRE
jgi:multidrug efflux system membrane fusion protein